MRRLYCLQKASERDNGDWINGDGADGDWAGVDWADGDWAGADWGMVWVSFLATDRQHGIGPGHNLIKVVTFVRTVPRHRSCGLIAGPALQADRCPLAGGGFR